MTALSTSGGTGVGIALPACIRSGHRSGAVWLLAVGVAAALLCLPFLQLVLFEEDGIWLNAAARLRGGQTLYRDFFQFLPPLSFLLTEAWLDLTGGSMVGARVVFVMVTAGWACFTYLACLAATGRAPAAAALALGSVVITQGIWTQLNHHWFTMLFSMALVWMTLSVASGIPSRSSAATPAEASAWRSLLAGLAGGAAAMVTPTRGALVLMASATVLLSRRRRPAEVFAFLGGAAALPGAMLAYLAMHGTLLDAFQSVILFPLHQYSAIQALPYGTALTWQTISAALIYPGCAVALAALAVRDGRAIVHDRVLMACAAFALAGLIGSYPRPDGAHLCFNMPLALPLAARGAMLLGSRWPARIRRLAVAFPVCLMVVAMNVYGMVAFGTLQIASEVTAAGPVRFADQAGRSAAVRRISALPAADQVFFYPYNPLMAVLAGRTQVSKYDLMLPGYTLPAQYQDACASVMREAGWVLLERRTMSKDQMRRSYPALQDDMPPERLRFEHVLEQAFSPVARDGDYELRRRTEAAEAGLCEGGWP